MAEAVRSQDWLCHGAELLAWRIGLLKKAKKRLIGRPGTNRRAQKQAPCATEAVAMRHTGRVIPALV